MTDPEYVRAQVVSVYSGDVIYDLPAPRSTFESITRCRKLCEENLCGNYDTSCTCPPHSAPIDVCIDRLESFDKAMLIINRFNVNLKDVDKLKEIGGRMQNICRDIHVSLSGSNIRNLPLADGPCNYCANCACKEGKGCRFPEFQVSSVSPYGILINEYLESVGIPPEPVGDTVTLYGFILYD